MNESDILAQLGCCVVNMDVEGARSGAYDALAAGIDAYRGIVDGLVVGMDEVGRLYERGEYFVPELICCADAMSAGLDVLRPHIRVEGIERAKRVVVGVVEGDTHDIGKNLVAMMLDAAGFEVHDLGRNVALGDFVTAAVQLDADVVGLSSLMTTTRGGMRVVIDELGARGARARVVIGGAAVSRAFAEEIGAHGYARNAVEAVTVVRALCDVAQVPA